MYIMCISYLLHLQNETPKVIKVNTPERKKFNFSVSTRLLFICNFLKLRSDFFNYKTKRCKTNIVH